MFYLRLLCYIGLILNVICAVRSTTPVVLWHSLGDNCCNSSSMGRIKRLIESQIKGVYVRSLEIGRNINYDTANGLRLNANTQVSIVCEMLRENSKLKNGYNAIGFSQGGQLFRAVAQRCPNPPMKNLISIGGQQQGIYGLPRCTFLTKLECDALRTILTLGAYIPWMQAHIVPASYWQDPFNEAEYKKASIFLADINQERIRNATYKRNLMKLAKFVMVKFENDTAVKPKETQWFGFYKANTATQTYTLQQSRLYKEDWLGLKAMDRDKKLHFLKTEGDHLQFSNAWFVKNIIKPFLT